MTIAELIQGMMTNWTFAIVVVLTGAVVLVNGWTDAPNAIASCVCTRAMKAQSAILMAAVFNFWGVWVMTWINSTVTHTIYNMVDFGGDSEQALVALCAALAAIVIWAVTAWKFGIPTSESHALIAGISGAAIALQDGIGGICWSEWVKVFYGLAVSTLLGYGGGYGIAKLTAVICRKKNRQAMARTFQIAQIGSGAAMAFLHGAQDGQKFIGVFLLGITLAEGQVGTEAFHIPVWLMAACSLIMGIGTSMGGYRIIKSVGIDMVRLEAYQGFSADIAAAGSLFLSTVTGLPVSTTHTKTTAVMGVGAAKRLSAVRWGVVKDMALTWILTFPGCGAIGYLMAKLFLKLLV